MCECEHMCANLLQHFRLHAHKLVSAGMVSNLLSTRMRSYAWHLGRTVFTFPGHPIESRVNGRATYTRRSHIVWYNQKIGIKSIRTQLRTCVCVCVSSPDMEAVRVSARKYRILRINLVCGTFSHTHTQHTQRQPHIHRTRYRVWYQISFTNIRFLCTFVCVCSCLHNMLLYIQPSTKFGFGKIHLCPIEHSQQNRKRKRERAREHEIERESKKARDR